MIIRYFSCNGLTIGNQIALKQMANHYQLILDSDNDSFDLEGSPHVLDSLEHTRGWNQLQNGLHVKLIKTKTC